MLLQFPELVPVTAKIVLSHWFQDDFWKSFISIEAFFVSLISQVVMAILPGKNPHSYFVCTGYFPVNLAGAKVKANLPYSYLLIASFLLHVFAGVRIKIHRHKQTMIDHAQSGTAAPNAGHISSQTLINFTTNIVSLLLLVFAAVVTVIVNTMDPVKFDSFPNYVWIYVLHHYTPTIILSSTVIIYYTKNVSLRIYVREELYGPNVS